MRSFDERGQVLLVTIMLIATAITIVLSTSFTTSTNIQTAKLEEDSQKALAAAEAGIESALLKGTTNIATLPGLSSFTGTAQVSETYDKKIFVTPLIQKDESYTFYLTDHPSLINPYTVGTLEVYYGTQGTNCDDVALELSLIYKPGSSYALKRFISDKGNRLGSENSDIVDTTFTGSSSEDLAGFKCKTNFTSLNLATYSNSLLLIVRALFNPTKLALEGSATLGPTANLKPQGKIITSQAKTSTGVVKTVQLFQSYPQIPSEFFVNSF